MGNETSKQKTPQYKTIQKQKSYELSQEQLYYACRKVEDIIHNFRARAGTDVVCTQLHKTWCDHLDKIRVAWGELTLPARRAMVQNIRELVLVRARTLHYVVVPRKGASRREKSRRVELLMEKICSELFDTEVLYKGNNLLDLVGDVLKNGGGGDECPPMLTAEIFHGFDLEESLKRRASSGGLRQNQSVDNLRKKYQRQSSSQCVVQLLSFLPKEMELESRRALTVKLVTEMRNAFLAHFSILVFGELIDDLDKVVHKYEYGSESETDVATSETDWDNEEDSSGESETKSSTSDDDLWLLSTQQRKRSFT